ncbi:uncharacterized protein LOC144152596 [Haemaphysalis longicornis]
MDTTCLSAVLLLLAALSATGAGETEAMTASVTTIPPITTIAPVTTTVAETTPAPMKESSNEVPAEKRPFENLHQDSVTTATPMVPLELPQGATRPAPNNEGGSSTDSGNAISNVDDNYKFNDINHDKGFSKQGQLENEGSASTETTLSAALQTAASNEETSGNTVPASVARGSTGSLAQEVATGLPADITGPVLSTSTIDSGDASASDLPVSPTATDPLALTPEVATPESSLVEVPRSDQALSTKYVSSGADLYPGSATDQQSPDSTTTEYTGFRDTGSSTIIGPIIPTNPTDHVGTSSAAVDLDAATISLVPFTYDSSSTEGGSASALSGNFERQQGTTPVAILDATAADHVQSEDAANTPPSADETASALTPIYGPSTVLPVQNAENQSQDQKHLDLAPSEKTSENPQTETDRTSTTVSLGETATVSGAPSEATEASVTHLKDVSETETHTAASQLLDESSPSEGGAGTTTGTTLFDTGSPLATSESASTTTLPSVNTAKMGRSNDPESMGVTTHQSMEATMNPTTPAAMVTSYSTKEEETSNPQQKTSSLPSFVSSAETTMHGATTTVSPSDSGSPVATAIQNSEATTATTMDHVSSGSDDFSTSTSPDNTQTTMFEATATAESAATATATTPTVTVDATTTVSPGTVAADTTTTQRPTEVNTSETPPSSADAQAETVTHREETTGLPLQGGTEGTTNEATTAPLDLSTQEATPFFERSTTGQYIFSEQITTKSPDVALTEETTSRYPTEQPTETSKRSEMPDTETLESISPVVSTTQEPTPASTTDQSTEMTRESSSDGAGYSCDTTVRTEVAGEKAEEAQTTAVPATKEPTETSETTTEPATATQPPFETTDTVTYEQATITPPPESPERSRSTSEPENEVTDQSLVSSVSHAASSASRSPKQLSESIPATTPPYTEQDLKHSFTTAPDLFSTTEVHTTWRQPATDGVSTQEASSQGATEQALWTTPVTTAATAQEWDTTTGRNVAATGSANAEEAAGSHTDSACEIVDGSLPVSCLHPEELNHTVTVKFSDLNRTRAETFRTEARIWLQDYYRKKGLLADPAVVFLSGDRGMDLISFFVVNQTRGSVVPSDAVVAVLNNMKVTFEDKLGTVMTDVFYGLPVVQQKGVGVAGFLGSQLGLVYVIVGASLAALLLLALLVVIMVKCRTLSGNQYSPDSEKLTKDLQMRAEMGDLRPGEEILKEEAQLKEALNGNGTHINGDGWVVPYSQIVSEHKSPADAQDTRL